MSKHFVVKANKSINPNMSYVKAAEGEEEDPFADMGFEDEGEEEIVEEDIVEDSEESFDDIDESLEDFEEDEEDIEVDNNITDHLIAECDACHNIFITAMVASDQIVESINGICPICDEESEQKIKWVIREIEEDNKEDQNAQPSF